MLFLPPKFLFLLLFATFTDAQSSDHTNFDAIQNISSLQDRNRYARNVDNCMELKSTDKLASVVQSKCTMFSSKIPGYKWNVKEINSYITTVKDFWYTFASNLISLHKIMLEIDDTVLTKLELNQLEMISGYPDINITNNKYLENIEFNVTGHMDIGKLIITGNEVLKSIKISVGNSFETRGEIIISKNPKLERVEFIGTGTYKIQTFMEIRQNVDLKSIANITNLATVDKLVVKGNRRLEKQYLDAITVKNKEDWEIQKEGECIFDEPIKNLADLDYCASVNTLKFAKGATGIISTGTLIDVEDRTADMANVPWEKVELLFSRVTLNAIKSDLCDYPEIIVDVKVDKPPCPTTTEPDTSSPPSGGSSGSGAGSGSGSGGSSNPSSTVSVTQDDSTELIVIAGIVAGVIAVVVIIALIVVYICFKKKKKPGQTFCSWLCCRKVEEPASKTIVPHEFAQYELGRFGDIVILAELPLGKGNRALIPEFDYYVYDKEYCVRWKGDLIEAEYDENLRSVPNEKSKKMSPIQKDFDVNMRRFDGNSDGDMMESYFCEKNYEEIETLARKKGKKVEEILNEMVAKRIKEKITEYHGYLKKNKLLREFPKPSKFQHEDRQGDDYDGGSSHSNSSKSGEKVASTEENKKEGEKELQENSPSADDFPQGFKKPTEEEKKLLDDFIMVMLLPNYCQVVEYNDPMKHVILRIIDLALDVMKNLPRLAEVPAPCVVLGDIHGQYRDLVRVFRMFNEDKRHGIFNRKYLFMGDYVDRGHFSLDVILLLFLLKIRHPTRFFLLRGNHEFFDLNVKDGFLLEITQKLTNTGFWDEIVRVFNYLPMAGLVGGRVLCMHGGISQHLKSLDDIRKIPSPLKETTDGTLADDLIWSDPYPHKQGKLYAPNQDRGRSVLFSGKAVAECCERLGVDLIVRAHQVQPRGFAFMKDCRQLVTVYTAPNYEINPRPGRNDGAILIVHLDGKLEFRKFGSDKFELIKWNAPKQQADNK